MLLQQLSPSGSGVHSSQLPCNISGKHVPCYIASWWGLGRHMSQNSGFFVHPSEKQKSAAQHSWSQFSSKHLSGICAWLGRSLQSSISFAAIFSRQASSGPPLSYSKPCGFPLHTRQHGRLPSTPFQTTSLPPLSACPYIKCSTQNFLCDLISGPSYDVPFLPIPLYFLHPFSCQL